MLEDMGQAIKGLTTSKLYGIVMLLFEREINMKNNQLTKITNNLSFKSIARIDCFSVE